MRLLIGLIGRVVLIALFCLTCAAGWVLIDTHRGIEAEATASAQRVARQLQSYVWLGSPYVGLDLADGRPKIEEPAWEKIASANVIAPAVCVKLRAADTDFRQLCGEWSTLGHTAPAWFAVLYDGLFGSSKPVSHAFKAQQQVIGDIAAETMREPMVQQAWHQVRMVSDVAALTVIAVTVLAFLGIGQALRPTLTIIDGLKELGRGNLDHRLPPFSAVEFRFIAEAINELADRLSHMTAERTRLTQRLFQVQEEERRSLARELHDEFGQCLTATAALAASIEIGAGADRPDQAQDARFISEYTVRMMSKLKSALSRLRPPDLDELGLEMSLRQLVSHWNMVAQGSSAIRLQCDTDLSRVSPNAALSIYRIAQECLTNALRHAKPSEVGVSVRQADAKAGFLTLVVEDDGGGTPASAHSTGFGILGIRERLEALGGQLGIERGEKGFRVSATIPAFEAEGIIEPAKQAPDRVVRQPALAFSG